MLLKTRFSSNASEPEPDLFSGFQRCICCSSRADSFLAIESVARGGSRFATPVIAACSHHAGWRLLQDVVSEVLGRAKLATRGWRGCSAKLYRNRIISIRDAEGRKLLTIGPIFATVRVRE